MEPTCNQCSDRLCLYEVERGICQQCINKKEAIAARKRRIYDRAYFAALGGMSADITPIEKDSAKYGYTPDDIIVRRSHDRAMRVASQWPAMQAELDALIGEVG